MKEGRRKAVIVPRADKNFMFDIPNFVNQMFL